VLVAGMMRSGTSAVAGALVKCGFDPGDDSDSSNVINPTGYFESQAVANLDEAVLRMSGATWYCPPSGDWEPSERVKALFSSAGVRVLDSFGSGPVVIKDPKASWFLPLWRQAAETCGRTCGAVYVWRAADEVAVSLWRSNRLPLIHGLALWVAYNRILMSALSGMPVVVCRYEEVVAHPDVLAAGVTDLGGWLGMAEPARDAARLKGFLSGSLRREVGLGTDHPVAAEVASLADFQTCLQGIVGTHRAFRPPPLPLIPDWASSLLEGMRQDLAEIAQARTRGASACGAGPPQATTDNVSGAGPA
jgi:hypothetical protein